MTNFTLKMFRQKINRYRNLRRSKSEITSVGPLDTKSNLEAVADIDQGFAQYELKTPSNQNAIDSLPGWNSAFPTEYGLLAGQIPLFSDNRIENALSAFGSIEDKSILEVGPLEGMHTYILNRGRPEFIDAVEANRICYLRCLVTKEILNLDRAKFRLGDIQLWLDQTEVNYDLAIASGILYHMPDPGEFLRLLSLRAKSIFIWTHYFDESAMPKSDVRYHPFSGRIELREVAGLRLHYHERGYQLANANASFCGGMKDRHFWLEKDEILSLLKHLGYDEVVVQQDDPLHSGGPCFSVFARRQ